MERISYSGLSLLTGSDIARAVVAYANALAQSETSASIEIPVRMEDGSEVHATLLIGPASQLVALEEPDAGPELEAPDVVERIAALTRTLGASVALPIEEGEQWDALDEP